MSDRHTLQAQAATIDAVLKRNHIPSHVGRSIATPRSLRFELMAEGVASVQAVQNLAGEFAAALGASATEVRRSAEGLCVEVQQPAAPLRLLPLCDRLVRAPALTALLGVDADGAPLLLRIPAAEVSNVLIAGMTGAGKTALARTLLTSLAIYNLPAQLQLVLIDPKARGFAPLQGIPHLLGELVASQEDARACLLWLAGEMDRRSAAQISTPALVVAIDELADLIQTGGSRIEALIARLCTGGREAGIHIIACAQKPTAEFIGSTIKSSFPIRLVGAVASREEARYATGINESGAERLEGKGDFVLITEGQAVRFQAAWIGPKDLEHVKALLQDGLCPAQWSRQPPAVATSGRPQQLAQSTPLRSEKGNPAYTLQPRAGATLWQNIIARLRRF